ncbi:MAG: cell division protein FtsZ, partial [Pseudomonadota bacterium]
ITGGYDLTLFELDEAANRIREEVDQDANIILGATFDESLEGLIRVSVVATGIDSAAAAKHAATTQQASLPRAVTGVAAKPQAKPETAAAVAAVAKPAAAGTSAQAAAQRAPAAAANVTDDVFAATQRDMDAYGQPKAAQAPVMAPAPAASAATQDNGFKPASTLFASAPQAMPARPQTPQMQAAPQPQQQQPLPAARMPRVEDFPPVVQAELKAQAAPAAAAAAPLPQEDERGPLGLLKRLATGFSRQEDEAQATQQPAPANLQPAAPPQPRREPSSDAAYYAPRRGQLDETGRPVPHRVEQEEDQLEIPAFLRRQAR